jgi:hypothetical protein
MTIRRYIANKDTTITNAYQDDLIRRAVNANMGKSDSLEVFYLYNQTGNNTSEKSRILVQFPVENIVNDRQLQLLPPSGSVQFILKMSNVTHPHSLPTDFSLVVNPLSRSWDEGLGLDMEDYKDLGEANWISASSTQAWTIEGGDFYSSPEYSQYFTDGSEDLEVDITSLVEEWVTGSLPNYGVIVRLSGSIEGGDLNYYTKKFSARGSEYFYKRPWIEARYDATVKDDRGRFYLFNPFVPVEYNYNTLYIHNKFRGNLFDLPTVGTGAIYVKLYSSPDLPLPSSSLPLFTGSTLTGTSSIMTATGSWVSTGIYKATVGINTSLTNVYDIWFDGAGSPIGYGGEIEILNSDRQQDFTKRSYSMSIKNLKSVYYTKEDARFQLFIRPDNWNPNSYTSVTTKQDNTIIDDMYFRVFRIVDNEEIVPYGTGSMKHTRLSYDINGNYMDLDISLLEPGYMYGIKFTVFDSNQYFESKELFKFRVEE